MSAASDPSTKTDGLAVALADFSPGDTPIPTQLRTSERVLARVTDGIYRQPGSALRELISNAYDADASRVTINTDRPRFERITISDNGNGMSPAVLSHVLHNIGGSAKRTAIGRELQVTDSDDNTLSPGGRRLIGKIGIGLFSVAQLTQTFQITTKVKNDNFSTVASVLLRQYSDTTTEVDDDGHYHAGEVLLWREPALDRAEQGTTITLTSVRQQTREALQSQEIWEKIAAAHDGNGRALKPPLFHIGEPATSDGDGFEIVPALPWLKDDGPKDAFNALAEAPFVANEQLLVRTPKYEEMFDTYLAMLWQLGLAAPLPYVGEHPFDLTGDADISMFLATGRGSDEAMAIEVKSNQQVRDAVAFDLPRECDGFAVRVDEVLIQRPITLSREQPKTSAALQRPIMLVGHHRSEFKRAAIELSGGPLEFSAYLFWTPKLIPGDHRGVLIRVNEASGTLFLPDFLGFPVNEQRRLPQITAEIFIHEGFDGALNIDRESFNMTHPHVVTLTRWFHGALRQLINRQKRLGARASATRNQAGHLRMQQRIQAVVDAIWQERQEGADPPPVVLLDDIATDVSLGSDVVRLPRSVIGEVTGPNTANRRRQREEVAIAITQVLAAYDAFDELDNDDFAELVTSLFLLASEDVK